MAQRKSALSIEVALLGFLRGQPMHGYEIYQQLAAPAGLGAVWHLKQGLLYAHLKRLEREGLLHSTVDAQSEGPPRRLLAITAAGEVVFQRWLKRPVASGRDLRLEFLAKLYFARQVGPEVALALLDAQEQTVEQRLDQLATRRASLSHEAIYDHLVIDYRYGQVSAALAWLASVRARIAQPALLQER